MEKQVFQTEKKSRWYIFTWVSRTLFLVFLFAGICVYLTISSMQAPPVVSINTNTPLNKNKIEHLKQTRQFKDFKIVKSKLEKIKADRERLRMKAHAVGKRINMVFYVSSWSKTVQKQSLSALKKYIAHIDMVAMESFFFDPKTGGLINKTDTTALNIVKKYHKKPIAQITNFIGGSPNADVVKQILFDQQLQTRFISNLLQQTKSLGFAGINIDFEDLNLKDPQMFTLFMQNIYTVFHKNGLLVSQDISPENDDFKVEELQKYNDYLVLMAYDQHEIGSNAGDISHQDWVEEQLDNMCKKANPDKVILALACYGYDWPENKTGTSLSYENALITAQDFGSKIIFDPSSANLHYSYKDGNGYQHQVYFTDAATNFNLIRKADDWNIAGVAIWRLGTEDTRLWHFIDKNLSLDSLKKTGFNFSNISSLKTAGDVQYIGSGEILDLISTPNPGEVKFTANNFDIANEDYVKLPTKYVIKRFGEAEKKVVLTFDDGPDPVYTPQVLSILKKEKVPGAFFVVGVMAEKNMELLRQEYDDGFEIGNHTFFHPDMSTIGEKRVKFELNATRRIIECVTGHSTILFRAPFNADAEPETVAEILPVAQSRKENYINIGEYIDPEDWQPGITADQIYNAVVKQSEAGNIILLHDAGGNRSATIAALPRIIKYFKDKGYQFTTVSSLMGKTRNDVMPLVKTSATTGITASGDYFFLTLFYYGNIILNTVFTIAIVLAILRTLFIAYLALKQRKLSTKTQDLLIKNPTEKVSIIIPAYNEEVTVIQSINSLLQTNYPDFELIFVDDGSKDATYKLVNEHFANHKQVKIYTKPNGGKASALNYGISKASSNYIVCIDADTQLKPDAVTALMRYFYNDKIAAVAGTVKVGNPTNILTRWQSIEYITSQNMDRRAFDLLNTITVVPGAIGAFKKSVVLEVGGFTTDTLAEDCDLTMRILKAGYTIKNAEDAIALTEAPETVKMLLKQRFRWSFGVLQSFWKNKNTLFNKKYGYFGMVGMPNILVYQIILPLFAPLADFFMLVSLVSGLFALSAGNNLTLDGFISILSLHNGFGQVLFYYLIFILVDIAFAALAFKQTNEKMKNLLYLFPQRFFWRQLMYVVLFKSFRKAIKGELNTWGTLKRTGNVSPKAA